MSIIVAESSPILQFGSISILDKIVFSCIIYSEGAGPKNPATTTPKALLLEENGRCAF
jgi:hypothetical protein